MQLSHSHRRSGGGRRRSSGRSRSRSRSPASKRRRFHHHRSSSGSRERHRVTPPPPSYKDRESNRYPGVLTDPSLMATRLSPDPLAKIRLRKPEVLISSSTLPYEMPELQSTEMGRYSATHVNPAPITLTERFTRMTAAGTAVYNKRHPGRLSDQRVPQLIITNNTQLPPATLIRQAKSISIVVSRKVNEDRKRSDDDKHHKTSDSALRIPRRSTEGWRPVFDRSEMKFYQSIEEELEISKRLLDCISTLKPRETAESHDYNDTSVAITGRFYGSRVDTSAIGSRQAHPIDPSDTPRNPSYFLHDDRDDHELTSRRNWRTRFPNNNNNPVGHRRDSRAGRSPVHSHSPFHTQRAESEDRWQHDKFNQIDNDDPMDQEQQHERSNNQESDARFNRMDGGRMKQLPRPVPAPKPILWSTIGKDSLPNGGQSQSRWSVASGDSAGSSSVLPYRARSSNRGEEAMTMSNRRNPDDVEDVRIDMEPVLDVTVE